ncbi:MAG: polysaccharide deacetylase family protein [Eubacteriales bacterium]|nr:polysaccharide deacetylase family protein [Christensenellaceae bacterium]MDY4709100.1 polysaccharide deacetylase family protein [Eubacteriales bacterium]MDY6078179.1 polysaccharide deacetylase family protein [Eubacteriales bacterium]
MFIVVKKKDVFKALAIAITATLLIATAAIGGIAPVYLANAKRLVPVYSVETEEKVVALTFDAAWGADKTRGIIELLEKYDADGTFFLVGFWIDKYPEETKLIAEKGLEIGNHSNNHLHMSKLQNDEIKKEIESVNVRLQELTGKTPKYFRPPFGEYDNKLLENVAALDMVGVQWSVDSLDWKGLSGEEIAKRVLSRVHNGAIILFHNNSDHVLDALPIILPKLKADGYKCVSIDELVMTENYIIDNRGVQHRNA